MTGEPSLAEKVLAIHDGLHAAAIAHAFGGALALAYYGEPRLTIDIDVNVFAPPDAYADVHAALGHLGVRPEGTAAAASRDGQSRSRWGRTPVDLFFSYDALHDAMRDARRSVPFGDRSIDVLAPEHLLVCKVIFNRPKDWLDVEAVLSAVPDLDRDAIARWLGDTIGADDPRSVRFARLAASS